MKKIIFLLTTILLSAYFFFNLALKLNFISPQDNLSQDSFQTRFVKQTAIFNNQQIEVPQYLANIESNPRPVLGLNTAQKHIEINLSTQRLYAFENNRLIYNFLISSGKWGRTPTGVFKIWSKFTYTLMSGGSRALRTYYYLPNVPYTMFFYNQDIPKMRGYGIHGTYWHENFGHPMSHGCINMKTEQAELIFNWAKPDLKGGRSIYADKDNPGTTIIIYGKAPAN